MTAEQFRALVRACAVDLDFRLVESGDAVMLQTRSQDHHDRVKAKLDERAAPLVSTGWVEAWQVWALAVTVTAGVPA